MLTGALGPARIRRLLARRVPVWFGPWVFLLELLLANLILSYWFGIYARFSIPKLVGCSLYEEAGTYTFLTVPHPAYGWDFGLRVSRLWPDDAARARRASPQFGFGCGIMPLNATGGRGVYRYDVRVEHWVLMLPVSFMAIRSVRRRWRVRRRLMTGCCLTCGYDLRGTPGRCPECGAAPVVDAVAATKAARK